MPYTTTQSGHFRFTLTVDGVRHRKNVACPRAYVAQLYHEWERRIYDGMTGKHKLFDKLNEYKAWSIKHKSKDMVTNEAKTLELIRQFFGDKLLTEIERHHVKDFAKWRKHFNGENASDATVKHAVQTLSFFTHGASSANTQWRTHA
jgi:hypothetical protein